MVAPPLHGTDAFNKANPSSSVALAQNQRAKREIARSSQDNLKACTDVSVQLEDLFVPPLFKPPVIQPRQARQSDSTEPHFVDESGMRKWSNDMLKGHPGGRASTWEQ